MDKRYRFPLKNIQYIACVSFMFNGSIHDGSLRYQTDIHSL
jgi:hypothetical protein